MTVPVMTYEEVRAEFTAALPDDIPPDDTAPSFEYACEVCGKELFYGGRGRKPKLCDVHKSSARKGGPATPRKSAVNWAPALAQALQDQFVMIGVVAYTFDAFDGQTIIDGSPKLASSLVTVAEQNPAVKDALTRLVTAGAWAGVATAVAAIAIPIMAHHNLLPKSLGRTMAPAPTAG